MAIIMIINEYQNQINTNECDKLKWNEIKFSFKTLNFKSKITKQKINRWKSFFFLFCFCFLKPSEFLRWDCFCFGFLSHSLCNNCSLCHALSFFPVRCVFVGTFLLHSFYVIRQKIFTKHIILFSFCFQSHLNQLRSK